jgi:hypothetical protein
MVQCPKAKRRSVLNPKATQTRSAIESTPRFGMDSLRSLGKLSRIRKEGKVNVR